MGHLINPIGQRMGFANYWALNSQFFFDFNTLAYNSKVSFFFKTVIHDSLKKINDLTSGFLDGIFISSSINFFGFEKINCLLNFTLFDYMFAVFFFDGFYFAHLKRLKKLLSKIKTFYSYKKKSKRNRVASPLSDVNMTKKLKKLIILKDLTKSKISFFNKKFLNLRFSFIKTKLLQKLLQKKKLICDVRSNLWLFYLKLVSLNSFFQLCSISKINNLQLVGHFFFERNFLNAKMLTLYALKKLKNGFRLNLVMRNILFGLKKIKSITGYKICVSGRFTRKQIATYRWHRRGILSLNYFSAPIDYSQNEWRSWFGLCGIKIWIQKKKKQNKKGFILFFKNKKKVNFNNKSLF